MRDAFPVSGRDAKNTLIKSGKRQKVSRKDLCPMVTDNIFGQDGSHQWLWINCSSLTPLDKSEFNKRVIDTFVFSSLLGFFYLTLISFWFCFSFSSLPPLISYLLQ